jgi:hypothetical protein
LKTLAFQQDKCNKCKNPDPRECPGISHVAQRYTLISWTPAPKVKIDMPSLTEIRANMDLTILANILVPDDRICCKEKRCSDRPFQSDVGMLLSSSRLQYSTFAEGNKLASVKWSVIERAPVKSKHKTLQDQQTAAGPQQDVTLNTIDLNAIGVESRSAVLLLPKAHLQPGHYYQATIDVEMSNPNTIFKQIGSDSVLIFVKAPALSLKLLFTEEREGGLVYPHMDGSFATFLGRDTRKNTFPVRISLSPETFEMELIPDSAHVTYMWNCRKWPIKNVLEYWRKDNDIVEPDVRVVEKCFFNDTVPVRAPYPLTKEAKDASFPCCNRPDFVALSVELEDRYTYEFNLTMHVHYATDPEHDVVDEFQGFRRMTIRRQDSPTNDFFLYGRTIEMYVRKTEPDVSFILPPDKIRPNEMLVLESIIPKDSVERALQTWEGKCEHPVRPGQPGCRIELKEVAHDMDLTNPLVSESPMLIPVFNHPDIVHFAIKPKMIAPGVRFLFRLSIKTLELSFQGDIWRERGFAELMLEVNHPPRNGKLLALPHSGKAFLTEFTLEASRVEDSKEDLPLKYEFYYSVGKASSHVYISPRKLNPFHTMKLPMVQSSAAEAPCSGDDALPGGPCAAVTVYVSAVDLYGAHTEYSSMIMLTFDTKEAVKYNVLAGFFDDFRRQAFLAKDYAQMTHSLKLCSELLKDSATAAAILEENNRDPLSLQLTQFKTGLLDTLLDATNAEDGRYMQPSLQFPVNQMVLQGLNEVLEQNSDLAVEERVKCLSLVAKLGKSIATTGAKAPDQLLDSILAAASKMVGRILWFIPGVSQRRQQLSQAAMIQRIATIEDTFELLTNTIRDVCSNALIGAAMSPAGWKTFTPGLFTVTCSKIAKPPPSSTKTAETAVPESDNCGRVDVVMEGWSSAEHVDLATVVFKYNPAGFPVVATANGLSDGQLQASYGIHWPLHPSSCPVLIRHWVKGVNVPTPFRKVSLRLSVAQEAARRIFPLGGSPFAFEDIIFSATCQQWYSSSVKAPGAWWEKNASSQILESSSNDICNFSHWASDKIFVDPPPLANGSVVCTFDTIPEPASYTSTGLYAVITEATDCLGVIDVPSRRTGIDWQIGQFSFIEGGSSMRNVCDKCKVCGGTTDCVLSCSSKTELDETLDLCGVCGGLCTLEAGCTQEACNQPYFRYAGNKFPRDYDVRSDGMTAGLLRKGRQCPQSLEDPTNPIDLAPARSPNGICKSIAPPRQDSRRSGVLFVNARVERYPYHNDQKICWENSNMVPIGSPDKLCQFQAGSFFLDDPTGRTLTLVIQALDENEKPTDDGGVEIADKLLHFDLQGLLTFAGNGTRTIQEVDTRAKILSRIDRLSYLPPPHWSSHFPPIRYRRLKFSVQNSLIPPTIIKMRIRPVNDPPKVTASLTPYQIQEDRIYRLQSPAVQIVDDAAEFAGHYLNVTLQVLGTGSAIRTTSVGRFQRYIAISGSLQFVNDDLSTLDYLGAENQNEVFDPSDTIKVTVNDNGFGGEAPYNVPQTHELLVNLTAKIQNDPPIVLIQKKSVIFQNGEVRIKGAHVVDPDGWQHVTPMFEGTISTAQGVLTVNVLSTNCTVLSRKPYAYTRPTIWRYVDESMPLLDPILVHGVGFLKLDGRPSRHKAIYLNFRLDKETMESVRAYPGVKMVVALYKRDCYDAMSDNGAAAAQGITSQWLPGCIRSGSFPVSMVRCPVQSEAQPFFWERHTKVEGVVVGTGHFTSRQSEWIYAVLDAERVIVELAGSETLCLRLEDVPSVNETLRFLAPVPTAAARRTSTEENLLPRLDIFMGSPANASFFTMPSDLAETGQDDEKHQEKACFLEIRQGGSIQDVVFEVQTSLNVMNGLFDDILYQISGSFANRFGDEPVNVTFKVADISARESCLKATEVFGPQACDEFNHANTTVYVVPVKQARTPIRMQPWYADRWVRTKSIQGKLPVYVQLEDCGNRGWEEECPYRLQIVPDSVIGEYAVGRLTVEISSRLGTLTVPESLRVPLTFEKGTGFRDQVVRITGFAPDIRRAMLDIVYHSQLDKHLQYKNQYSDEDGASNLACSRLCFLNDIGAPAFLGEDEVQGCNKQCGRKIYERTNKQLMQPDLGDATFDEKGIFLDDVIITYSDNGMTGVGLDRYTTLMLYNIYTIAVNDRPCIIFRGRKSNGCRRECAHPGLPSNCYDSGIPFDLNIPFETVMYEGQTDPILVGGLVSKVVDEYEFSRKECRTKLDGTLASRGDDVTDPLWLIECPRLNVRLSAKQGNVALNSREFIDIFLGSEKTFASPIAFLGYPLDSNSAMRMIRYKMSEENPYFNSNLGTETVRIVVSDQGFSGSDPSGEFDGSSSESVLEFVIHIKPVNNLPIITVPRASDPIEVQENVPTQMSTKALGQGLSVQDFDSDECFRDGNGYGKLTLILSVPHGRLFINPVKSSTLEALPGISQDNLDFFSSSACSEVDCGTRQSRSACVEVNKCSWDTSGVQYVCRCKLLRRSGKKCSAIKIRGESRDIKNAMSVMVYDPVPKTNYLSWGDAPEVLSIRVSDKRNPDDTANTDVSCGETLTQLVTWTEGSANLRTMPVSQPCIVTIDPPILNGGFEEPAICEGSLDCQDISVPSDGMVECVGVAPMPDALQWTISGIAGISYLGWEGDVPATEGAQHLYLSPGQLLPAVVTQTIQMLVIGARYKVQVTLGARTTGNRGSAFKLEMLDKVDYEWAAFLPTINEDLVVSLPGKDTYQRETQEFTAHRTELPLKLTGYAGQGQLGGGRLVFVDDVRVRFLAYQMLEDTSLQMRSVRVEDPDYTNGVLDLMRKNGFDFHIKVTVEAKHGNFVLKTNKCTVMPPIFNFGMNPDKRVQWGVMCWAFTGNVEISNWANMSMFRPDCPPGWAGKGTQEEPCVDVPLRSLNMTWSTPYFVYFYPSSQSQVPQRYAEFVGSKEGIEEVIRNRILYVPDPYFNTENQGKELLKITSNDLANYNGDKLNPNIVVQNFVVDILAVNNAPNVTFLFPELDIKEDHSVVLQGISISDPDLDEVKCAAEPCDRAAGFLAMRAVVTNGSMTMSPAFRVTDISILRDEAFGTIFSKNQYLQECVMKLSCTPTGGYLTLATRNMVEFCRYDPNRCLKVAMYCTIGEMASRGRTNADCLDQLNEAGLGGAMLATDELLDAEKKLQESLWSDLLQRRVPLALIKNNFLILVGTLVDLNAILSGGAVTYTPGRYFNGQEKCTFEVNDLGNKGILFPCDPEPNVPPELMFEYCSKKVPHAPLVTTSSFTINVKPINNYPVLLMFDSFGSKLLEGLPPMNALQNITRILNRMTVVDVDIQETVNCKMSVSVASRAGGSLSFNITKAPKLDYGSNPTQTDIVAIGSMQDIQVFVSNIEYRSDPQNAGIEALVVSINDAKCTGDDLVPRFNDAETFVLQMVISRPKKCRFATCVECIASLEEDCGWCPFSCNGRGKCKEAVGRNGPPKLGDCPSYCVDGVCLRWNMCEQPPDMSWMTGAVGAPILLVAMVSFYFLFMWSRRYHGTLPMYAAKSGAGIFRSIRSFSLSPQEGSRVGQVFYLACCVIIGALLPGVLQELLQPKYTTYSLGEAMSFLLQTDACQVSIVSDGSMAPSTPAKIETRISSNGTLADVLVFTDFCAEDQFILVNNSRPESIRYADYICDILLRIPEAESHTIPVMHITNVGRKMTTIRTAKEGQIVNFRPNALTISGTLISVDIFNLRVRSLIIPMIEAGSVRLQNLTFTSIQIETDKADVAISVASGDTMMVPIDIQYRQTTNSICFVSAKSADFVLQNTCDDSIREVNTTIKTEKEVDGELKVTFTNVTKRVLDWKCTKPSRAVLVPAKRNLQPGLMDLQVEIISKSGQIYFQAISPDRVPPRGGIEVLDSLYLYDGLHGSRELSIEETGAKLLDVVFHPGGSKRPKEEWLDLVLSGPSIPVGQYVWVSDIRYLLLSRKLLQVLSFGMLVPAQANANVPLKPAFCPEFDAGPNPESTWERPATTRVNRISQLRRSVQDVADKSRQADTLGSRRGWEEQFPGIGNSVYLVGFYRMLYESVKGSEMPTTSYIAFLPRTGAPIVFEIDSQTGKTVPKEVVIQDHPLILALLVFGLFVPAVATLVFIQKIVLTARIAIKNFRQRRLNQEICSRKLLNCLRPENANDEQEAQELIDLKLMLYAKSNFFYFLDYQVGDPDTAASLIDQAAYTATHLGVIVGSFGPAIVFLLNWRAGRFAYECSQESEPYKCGQSWTEAEFIIVLAIIIHCSVSVAELYSHYANLRFTPSRKVLRLTWYSTQIAMTAASLFYTAVVVTWIFIGLFVNPAQFMPYVSGFVCGTLVLAKFWWRSAITNERTANSIRARAERLAERGYGLVPIEAVVSILDRTLEKILRKYKLSVPTLVNQTFQLFLFIFFVEAFLFVGFHALTDTSNIYIGSVNSIVIGACVLALDRAVNAKKDKEIQAQDINVIVKEAISESVKSIQFVSRQVDIGVLLMETAKKVLSDYHYCLSDALSLSVCVCVCVRARARVCVSLSLSLSVCLSLPLSLPLSLSLSLPPSLALSFLSSLSLSRSLARSLALSRSLVLAVCVCLCLCLCLSVSLSLCVCVCVCLCGGVYSEGVLPTLFHVCRRNRKRKRQSKTTICSRQTRTRISYVW